MDAPLAAWLADHHGVVSRVWLFNEGYTLNHIRAMLDSGLLVSLQRGVYVTSCSPRTPHQRLVALAMKYGAVASHITAGHEWGFRRLGGPSQVHVTVLRNQRTVVEDVAVHMSSSLTEADIVRRDDGVVLTSPARTVFDLASLLTPPRLESVLEQCLSDKKFTLDTLVAVGERLSESGRDGTKRFAELIAARPKEQRPVGSDLELRFERAWNGSGLPRLERQRPLRVTKGPTLHPDFAEPQRRFLIEVDHATFHGGRHDRAKDHWRDRQYRLLGWHCERVTNHDINERLAETVTNLARAYYRRPTFAAD
jgi:very-short-patch-repair endonuclease